MKSPVLETKYSFTYVEADPQKRPEQAGHFQDEQPSEHIGRQALRWADARFVDTRLIGTGYDSMVPALEPTPDAGINLDDEEVKNSANIIEAIELQHYARMTPGLDEQAADMSRTNTLKYRPRLDAEPIAITEHEALVELQKTLTRIIATDAPEDHMREIEDIRENLTFLGEKELTEATAGLAVLWRDYLEEHPDNKLCLITLKTTNEKVRHRKSGPYVIGRILDNFSDEELVAYKGRIIDDPTKLDDMSADPNHTRIVVVDDSTRSGSQLRSMLGPIDTADTAQYLGTVMMDTWPEHVEYAKSVEINLLVAQGDLLEDGFRFYSGVLGRDVQVPVKAYYKAHDAEIEGKTGSRTTGVHSSVDYGFENTIRDAIWASGSYIAMPPLTYIERPYHKEPPLVVIEQDGTIKRRGDEPR